MKCSKCGLELSSEELNDHNLVCSYALNDSDYKDLIPCEICNELISFEDYERHVSICSHTSVNAPIFQPPPNFSEFPILQFTLPNNSRNSNNIEEMPENIQNSINQINNDPIARSLFSVFVGNINNFSAETPEDLGENQAEEDLNEEDLNEEDLNEENANGNENFNFIPNQLNNMNINENLQISQNTLLNMFESILNNQLGDNEEDNYDELINLEDHSVGISDIDGVSQFLFEEIECPICSETKLVSRKTKCNHHFCDECLQEWLKESKKCPTCMVDLE
jgi:hypothetical protein